MVTGMGVLVGGKEVRSSLGIHAYQELSNVNISRNLSFGALIS